jgi:hypothetical protein
MMSYASHCIASIARPCATGSSAEVLALASANALRPSQVAAASGAMTGGVDGGSGDGGEGGGGSGGGVDVTGSAGPVAAAEGASA